MFLAGALFALFMTGCWLYCLTDAILTPAPECRGLPKPAWVAVIAVTFIVGAFAWLIVRRPVRDQSMATRGRSPAMASAGRRGRRRGATGGAEDRGADLAKGPDDDRDFLRALAAAIRRNPPVS